MDTETHLSTAVETIKDDRFILSLVFLYKLFFSGFRAL